MVVWSSASGPWNACKRSVRALVGITGFRPLRCASLPSVPRAGVSSFFPSARMLVLGAQIQWTVDGLKLARSCASRMARSTMRNKGPEQHGAAPMLGRLARTKRLRMAIPRLGGVTCGGNVRQPLVGDTTRGTPVHAFALRPVVPGGCV